MERFIDLQSSLKESFASKVSYNRNLFDTWDYARVFAFFSSQLLKGTSLNFSLINLFQSRNLLCISSFVTTSFNFYTDDVDMVRYLMHEGILPDERFCPQPRCADHPMHLYRNESYKEKCYWVCRKRYSKKHKRLCQEQFSVRSGSFFARSKLTLPEQVMK